VSAPLPRVALPQVTLVCADCAYHELAADALRRSMAQCQFGRVLFFTDRDIAIEGVGTVRIPPLRSVAEYSQFVLKGLARHVETPHVLVIQWDGFVLDGAAWRDEFLQYDYVGAPWPWHGDGHVVGNGGFSLRSRRLLEALQDPRIANVANEDEVICRLERPRLEREHAIRFAPAELAEAFSFEHGPRPARVFGFHGLFNFGEVWREDAELSAILDRVPRAQFAKNEGGWLFERLRRAGRVTAATDAARRAGVRRELSAVLREGVARHEAGDLAAAEAAYAEALVLAPGHPDALHLLGLVRAAAGRTEEAIDLVRRAVRANPRGALYQYNLGLLLAGRDDAEGAIAGFRKALALDPALDAARDALAGQLLLQGRDADACAELRQLVTRRGDDASRLRLALALPPVARSREHIAETREGLSRELDRLLARPARIEDPLAQVGATGLALAFHGEDDRPLLEKLARAFLHACPSLAWTAAHCRRPRAAGRLRIGFLSRFLHEHPIGNGVRGLLARLDRTRFESIALFAPPFVDDACSTGIRQTADRSVMLPDGLAQARELVAAQELDVLCYPDIGLEPMSYFLAFSRLAPVQCTSTGHPVTSGIPNVDWFVSSSLFEPEGGARHYSERLAEIADAGVLGWWRRPAREPARGRRALGLPESGRLYLCPQSPSMLHPDFDAVLLAILDGDPGARVGLAGSRRSGLEAQARRRLERSLGAAAWRRVTLLPERSSAEWRALAANADVVLDTPHFGGADAALDAFSQGTPVLTWPGALQRGRHVHAMYRAMDIAEPVAASLDAYASLALGIAREPDLRAHLRTRIEAASAVLYENDDVVRRLERFFEAALERRDALVA